MTDIAFLSPETAETILTAHIKALSRATGGTGVVDGNALAEDDPVSMNVTVDAGAVKVLGVDLDVDAGDAEIGAAHATLDRIDIITRDSEGTIAVIAGTPAVVEDPKGNSNWHQYKSPVPSDEIPLGSVILGAVHVAASVSSISDDDIWMFAGRVLETADLPIVTVIGSPGLDTNIVAESAIRAAIDALMPLSYLTTTIGDPGSDAKVPSEKAVRSGLAARIATSAITTSIASPGEDTKLPSEQAVREELDLRPLLSLLTTRGDTIYRGESAWARRAKGAQYTVYAMGANDPDWSTLTSLIDTLGSAAQGQIPYRNDTVWALLNPAASANSILTSAGAAANPAWATLSALLDTIGNTQGYVIKRGAETWAAGKVTSTRIWDAPALAWKVPATGGAALTYDTGTNGDIDVLDFDAATDEYVRSFLNVPSDIDADGTVTIKVKGYGKTAGSGNVVWILAHSAIKPNNNESWDAAFTEVSSGAKAVDADQDQTTEHEFTATVSTLGWEAGDGVRLKLIRDANNASDTYSYDFRVTHVSIIIPTARVLT